MRMQIAGWIATSCITLGVFAPSAHAGQWLDAMLNAGRPAAYPIGSPTPVTQNYASVVSNYGTYAPQPPSATGINAIPFGAPQTVAGYLPTASYDTTWNQTPVTYYRPVTSFDQRTGTTVTSLQPCTSVQYQAQRTPVIAPRPLLGDYGMQANRWPGITGPGYNPTGLAYAANYPGFQQLPANGYPVAPTGYAPTGYVPNGTAPLGTSGSSMGMPVSSLPVTSIPAYAPNGFSVPNYAQSSMVAPAAAFAPTTSYSPSLTAIPYVPTVPYASPYASSYAPNANSQVMPAAAWQSAAPTYPMSSLPTYSTPSYAAGPTYSSSAVPTYSNAPVTAYSQPSNCANGYCAQPGPATSGINPSTGFGSPNYPSNPGYPSTPGMTPPNIPGATLTPLGPPVVTPAPTSNPSFGNPGYGLPGTPGSGAIMPPAGGSIMPPGSFDRESTIQPSLNGTASVQRATIDHLVGGGSATGSSLNTVSNNNAASTTDILPKQPASSNNTAYAMKEIDRPSASLLPYRESAKPTGLFDPAFSNRQSLPIPQTLPDNRTDLNTNEPFGSRVKPLEAPAGIDTRSRKIPSLSDSDDPVATRSERQATQKNTRIVSSEDSDRPRLSFISGTSKPSMPNGNSKNSEESAVRFRSRTSANQ